MMIQHFQTLKVKPLSVSAGAFHCAVLASDGRVFTWGWDYDTDCLGHDDKQEHVVLPTAVAGLGSVKARYVSAGYSSTFVVTDNGDVYSFGCNSSRHLGVEV
jgi:alpha-tubulin suppressor-like RCC1 family protein